MATEGASEMFTAAKLAEKLGLSPAAVKKLLEAQRIEPVVVKGPCKYYGAAALKKLQGTARK